MMRGLSLWQPWATLVAVGAKRVETRDWGTNYRGPVAIHATKRFPRDAQDLCLMKPFREVLDAAGCWPEVPGTNGNGHELVMPRGAIVAVALLIRCTRSPGPENGIIWAKLPPHERAFGDFTQGRYLWLLDQVRALPEPIPCKGAQGLWPLDADLDRRVLDQVAEPVS